MTFYLTLSSSVCGFSCFPETFGDSYPCIWDSVTFCWLLLVLLVQEPILFSYCFQEEQRRSRQDVSGLVFHMWVQLVTHGASPSHRPRLLHTVLAWKQTFHLVQIGVRIYTGWSCLCYSNHLTDHSSTLHAPSFPHLWIWVLPTGPPIFRNSSQFLIYKDFPFLFL